jgi:hypothetical protein
MKQVFSGCILKPSGLISAAFDAEAQVKRMREAAF